MSERNRTWRGSPLCKTWKIFGLGLVAVCAAAFGGDLALQPIPETAVFSEEGYFVWCGSVVKDDDGTYHLFYSRWKKSEGVRAWRPHAEIARATSKDLFGTFTPQGVVLPERGGRFWDGHDWKLAQNPLVTDTTLRWADGRVEKVNRLERPQLYFENGRPVALLAAVGIPWDAPRFADVKHSFNVRIPLVPVAAPMPSNR